MGSIIETQDALGHKHAATVSCAVIKVGGKGCHAGPVGIGKVSELAFDHSDHDKQFRFSMSASFSMSKTSWSSTSLLSEQGLQQCLSRDVQVLGHVSEDSAQGADP